MKFGEEAGNIETPRDFQIASIKWKHMIWRVSNLRKLFSIAFISNYSPLSEESSRLCGLQVQFRAHSTATFHFEVLSSFLTMIRLQFLRHLCLRNSGLASILTVFTL